MLPPSDRLRRLVVPFLSLVSVTLAQYALIDEYLPTNFFDKFNFYTVRPGLLAIENLHPNLMASTGTGSYMGTCPLQEQELRTGQWTDQHIFRPCAIGCGQHQSLADRWPGSP